MLLSSDRTAISVFALLRDPIPANAVPKKRFKAFSKAYANTSESQVLFGGDGKRPARDGVRAVRQPTELERENSAQRAGGCTGGFTERAVVRAEYSYEPLCASTG